MSLGGATTPRLRLDSSMQQDRLPATVYDGRRQAWEWGEDRRYTLDGADEEVYPGLPAVIARADAIALDGADDATVRAFAAMIDRKARVGLTNDRILDIAYRAIQSAVGYQRDADGFEAVQTAPYTLRRGIGDCEDHAILGAAVLSVLAIPARYVLSGPRGEATHIWLEAFDRGSGAWLAFDTTIEARPGVPPAPAAHVLSRHPISTTVVFDTTTTSHPTLGGVCILGRDKKTGRCRGMGIQDFVVNNAAAIGGVIGTVVAPGVGTAVGGSIGTIIGGGGAEASTPPVAMPMPTPPATSFPPVYEPTYPTYPPTEQYQEPQASSMMPMLFVAGGLALYFAIKK